MIETNNFLNNFNYYETLSLLSKINNSLTKDKNFTEYIGEFSRVLEIDSKTLGQQLRISKPTVDRWISGQNEPVDLLKEALGKDLIKIAQDKVKKEYELLNFENDQQFYQGFLFLTKNLEISTVEISTTLQINKTTIERYLNKETTPYPEMRKGIKLRILDMIESKLTIK